MSSDVSLVKSVATVSKLRGVCETFARSPGCLTHRSQMCKTRWAWRTGIIIAVTGADCGRNPIRDLLWQDPFSQSDYGQGRVDNRYQLTKDVTDSARPGVACGQRNSFWFCALPHILWLWSSMQGFWRVERGLNKARWGWGSEDLAGPVFFPHCKVVVTILVFYYPHGCMCWAGNPNVPTQATWTPMSAQEAQQLMCLRGCPHIFSHGFAAAFFQDYSVFMSNFSTQ